MLLAVRRSFITPFDRGDISRLIQSMDDAIDQMQKTAKTILLFNVSAFEPEMKQMTECIVRSSGLLQQAIPLLNAINKNVAQLNSLTEQIVHIESEADDLYDAARKGSSRRGREPSRWISGSPWRSWITWRRSPTASTTSPTRSTASSPSTSEGSRVDVIIVLPLLIGLIGVALLFDFLNGLHDAANSIATIVSTRVLSPQYAVFWAAFFNFIAFLFFGLHVAQTIGKGIVEADIIDPLVVFGALIGAIIWNVVTWLGGIPSSSSHALVGGLLGAGIAKAGTVGIVWQGVLKTASGIVLSPAVGFIAILLVVIVTWAFARTSPYLVDRYFRILQFVSAALYSMGHGANDAQKTMGIIAVLLYSQGYPGSEFYVPFWVVSARRPRWAWARSAAGAS